MNYMHDQLGWSAQACRQRIAEEILRTRAKAALSALESLGWQLTERRVLDVGAGQGGLLLELLVRGADAYGAEPGQEFASLSRLRLEEAGFSAHRLQQASAESLPFPANSFDYVTSLQVLEHVQNPERMLSEMYRVLRPGALCFISTENYLSFYEPHYRVFWFPLLPKHIGSAYLKWLGRPPDFLRDYIHYTTYPQIWRLCRRTGFENLTYRPVLEKLSDPDRIRRKWLRAGAMLLAILPVRIGLAIVECAKHLGRFARPGVQVHLLKPL